MKKWHRVSIEDIRDREEQGPLPLSTGLADLVYVGNKERQYPRLHIVIADVGCGVEPFGLGVAISYKKKPGMWTTHFGIPIELMDDFIVTLQRVQNALVRDGAPVHVDSFDEVRKVTVRTYPGHQKIQDEIKSRFKSDAARFAAVEARKKQDREVCDCGVPAIFDGKCQSCIDGERR